MRCLIQELPGSEPRANSHGFPYLEGQGKLVSGLIMGITRVTMWAIGVIKPLTKFPHCKDYPPRYSPQSFRLDKGELFIMENGGKLS